MEIVIELPKETGDARISVKGEAEELKQVLHTALEFGVGAMAGFRMTTRAKEAGDALEDVLNKLFNTLGYNKP